MKVKAITNIKTDKGWVTAGEVFEATNMAGLEGLVETVGDEPTVQPEPRTEMETEAEAKVPTRRGRRKAE